MVAMFFRKMGEFLSKRYLDLLIEKSLVKSCLLWIKFWMD